MAAPSLAKIRWSRRARTSSTRLTRNRRDRNIPERERRSTRGPVQPSLTVSACCRLTALTQADCRDIVVATLLVKLYKHGAGNDYFARCRIDDGGRFVCFIQTMGGCREFVACQITMVVSR